jgi:hypothetical protein
MPARECEKLRFSLIVEPHQDTYDVAKVVKVVKVVTVESWYRNRRMFDQLMYIFCNGVSANESVGCPQVVRSILTSSSHFTFRIL